MRPSRLIATALFGALAAISHVSRAQTPGMIEFSAFGKTQQGLPLLSLTSEVVVLGRDGWMHSLDPRKPESGVRQLDQTYEPISVSELRNQLRAEFGHGFDVKSTQSFLVVQPAGRGNQWPTLFEQSHRAFISYLSRRGVKIREGRFPMVAVVMPDEGAMYREFEKLNIDVKRVAGLYSGESNRVITHDGGRSEFSRATVRHEAAHQSAYNSGVHSRLGETPRWISEGIGQMFEPAGMTNSRNSTRLDDRINHESLQFLKKNFPRRGNPEFTAAVMQLVSDNTMFENSATVDRAYNTAWAMMFYLAEREPDKFAELLNLTVGRPPFREYSRTERVRDLEQAIGYDTIQFSKNVSWFLQSM